jgi:phage terminase large subunit
VTKRQAKKPVSVAAEYTPYGNLRALFAWASGIGVPPQEVLIEGPAGTGKSRAVGQYLYKLAEDYPGARFLVLRKRRKDLTDSFMVTFERDVLPPGHEAFGKRMREGRHSWRWKNGSEIVLGGLDDPRRTFSAEYDMIYVQEATETQEEEWEFLFRCLRSNVIPYQQMIADCNPDGPGHWLNQRARTGRLFRVKTRHEDNPTITPEYLELLRNLKGVRRARLYEGLWVAAEGQVWPNWSPDIHVVTAPTGAAREKLGIQWYFGSVDWGWSGPGVMQVWGVGANNQLHRVVEIYRTGQSLDWWAQRACDLWDEFELRRIICDPYRPECIEMFNYRLGPRGGRDRGQIAVAADSRRTRAASGDMGGLDMVRWSLDLDNNTGKPRIQLWADAPRMVDEKLIEEHKPWKTEMEVPEYVWARDEVTGQVKEGIPDKDCADHGCDAMRYAVVWAWGKALGAGAEAEKDESQTCRVLLNMDKVFKPKRSWEPEWMRLLPTR